MLEYGVAVIITQIKRFHQCLRGRIVGSEQEKQFELQQNDDSQTEVINFTEYYRKIKIDREKIENDYADVAEEIKAIKEEIAAMKFRTDACAKTEEIKEIKKDAIVIKERMDSYATVTFQMREIMLDGRKHYIL